VTYTHAVDSKDWVLYRSVFADNAVIDYTSAGGIKGDKETVAKWIQGVFKMFDGVQHAVSNFIIVVRKDKATLRAMFHNPVCLKYVPWPRPFFIVGTSNVSFSHLTVLLSKGGWYKAKLARVGKGWKITHLSEDIAWNQAFVNFTAFAVSLLTLMYFVLNAYVL
jgi:hypothetical protein